MAANNEPEKEDLELESPRDDPDHDHDLEAAEKTYESGEANHGQHSHNVSDLESANTDPETPDLEQARTQQTTRSHLSLEPTQSHMTAPQSFWKEVIFLITIISAQFLTQSGLALAIVPLHTIGASYGITNPGQLSWFAAAYSLTVGTFILIAGRLGDVYGHKRLFIIGFSWFALWSLLGGFAVYSNQIFFDITRALQGIGPAFAMPNGIAILGRTYPPGLKKGMVFSLFGAAAPGGFIIAAVFIALIAERVWWPWAYWIFAITCALVAIVGFLIIPHSPPPRLNDHLSTLQRIDAAGAVTGVVGLVCINFAWNQGPVVGWHVPYTYILLIVGFISMGLFAFLETRAPFPLVPLHIFSADVAFVLGCIAAGWSSFGVWVFYNWQFMYELRETSPLLTSAQFSPVAVSGFLAAMTTGFILSKVRASVVMMCAMLAFLVGIVLVGTMPVEQTYWAQLFVSLIIMPWGMDMSFPASTILLSDTMGHAHQGTAASLVTTIINYSISIGLGFAGTVETQINPDGTDLLKGYRAAYYMGIGLAGLGVVIAGFYMIEERFRLKKRKENESEEAH